MYLQELFEKYADWKIIKFFMENPEKEIHVKQLSRDLKISSGTASTALKKAAKDKLLNKKVIGNIHIYSLNRKSKEVRLLKKVVDEL